jgi:hypothetical protein
MICMAMACPRPVCTQSSPFLLEDFPWFLHLQQNVPDLGPKCGRSWWMPGPSESGMHMPLRHIRDALWLLFAKKLLYIMAGSGRGDIGEDELSEHHTGSLGMRGSLCTTTGIFQIRPAPLLLRCSQLKPASPHYPLTILFHLMNLLTEIICA